MSPPIEAVQADREADPDGAEILDAVLTFVSRFCALPNIHALVAVVLWVAHTHMIEFFHATARLAALSPEPASGKTRLLEVLNLLVRNALLALNATPATIFRLLQDEQITVLFDEADTIWSRRGADDENQDLRALLNAGYRRGAAVPRCVGPTHQVVMFDVFAAAALAGLGDLPDTIMSRAVVIRMRRRAPGEHIEAFRTRVHEPEGHELRDRLEEWAEIVGQDAGEAWPELPEGVVDRPAEIWEPLLAVADAAGGNWPSRARDACVALIKSAEAENVSLGVRLLADLRTIFGDAEALHTKVILERLTDGELLSEDAPWSDLRGKPLNPRGLANLLKQYGVASIKVWIDGRSLQGYRAEHLFDAWQRYLSPPPEKAEGAEVPDAKAENHPHLPDLPETRTPERGAEAQRETKL